MAATDGSEYLAIEVDGGAAPFARSDSVARMQDEDEELLWAAIERLPSRKQLKYGILRNNRNEVTDHGAVASGAQGGAPAVAASPSGAEAVDVTHLDRRGRQLLIENAFATTEQDNFNLLAGIKARLDRQTPPFHFLA